MQKETGHGDGKEREHDISQQAETGAAPAQQADEHGQHLPPVEKYHGPDRADLDDHRVSVGRELERERHTIGVFRGWRFMPQRPAGLVRELSLRLQPEQAVGDDEVASGRNGQELGDALHHAEHHGVAHAEFSDRGGALLLGQTQAGGQQEAGTKGAGRKNHVPVSAKTGGRVEFYAFRGPGK